MNTSNQAGKVARGARAAPFCCINEMVPNHAGDTQIKVKSVMGGKGDLTHSRPAITVEPTTWSRSNHARKGQTSLKTVASSKAPSRRSSPPNNVSGTRQLAWG